MSRKPNPVKEIVLEIVREQIELSKQGKLETLCTRQELANLADVSLRTIAYYLNSLEKDERNYLSEMYAKAERQRSSEKMKALHSDPQFAEFNRQRMKALNAEFAEASRERSRQMMKALNADPQFAEANRQRLKALNTDPDFAEANRQRMADRYKDPDYLKKHKERSRAQMKALNTNSKFTESIKARSSERMKALNADPQFAEAHKKRRKQNGIKHVEYLRKKAYHVEQRFYTSSQQEGAVALLLEHYLPNTFEKVNDGANFQVRNKGIKNGGIDFLVGDKFLEWHPIVLYSAGTKGGAIPPEEINSYKKVLELLLYQDTKKEFEEQYKKVLAINYRTKRQLDVSNSEYSGTQVALSTDERELYDFISKYPNSLPSFSEFKREFKRTCKYVKGFKVKEKTHEAVVL